MILRPLTPDADAAGDAAPAWPTIAARQRQAAGACLLISQPDHARLSGELAAHFRSPQFARITPEMARAIGMHDEGWGIYAAEARIDAPPEMNADGRPLSFIEGAPAQFLPAWARSIEATAAACAAGGVVVSRHFCSLGEFRLKHGPLTAAELAALEDFLALQRRLQRQWLDGCGCGENELAALLEVLQFCDLLSLYLCCGARRTVEFPNRLTDVPVRIMPVGGTDEPPNCYRLCPSPFQSPGSPERAIRLCVAARPYPREYSAKLIELAFEIV